MSAASDRRPRARIASRTCSTSIPYKRAVGGEDPAKRLLELKLGRRNNQLTLARPPKNQNGIAVGIRPLIKCDVVHFRSEIDRHARGQKFCGR